MEKSNKWIAFWHNLMIQDWRQFRLQNWCSIQFAQLELLHKLIQNFLKWLIIRSSINLLDKMCKHSHQIGKSHFPINITYSLLSTAILRKATNPWKLLQYIPRFILEYTDITQWGSEVSHVLGFAVYFFSSCKSFTYILHPRYRVPFFPTNSANCWMMNCGGRRVGGTSMHAKL